MIPLHPNDEKDLLLRLQAGDHAAFDALYHAYSPRIYRTLLRMTGDDEDTASELLQDTFVALWDHRAKIDPGLPVKSWLYRVAENGIYYHYRKLSRDKRLQQRVIDRFTESYRHIEEDLIRKESMAQLEQAIAALSPQRRQAFELCKLEGKSYAEAASIMGISVSTVSNHLVKATESVRRYLVKSNGITTIFLAALLFAH